MPVTEPQDTEKERPVARVEPKSGTQTMWEWTKSLAVALVIWYMLTSLLVQAFRIPSGSMENTLLVGDFLFVNKALYGAEFPIVHKRLPAFSEPQRSDIVVFDSVEEPGISVVKRIVGVHGDTIGMKDNVFLLNGIPVDEDYVVRGNSSDPRDPRMRSWQLKYLVDGQDRQSYRPTLKNWGPLVVPPDSFFVMGDNRDNSYDGRFWGFLGRDRIRGKPLFVYYSYDKRGLFPLPFLTAIRWSRFFSRLR
ncbi:MAG: signal peptidase I [Gemmatimonadetes bacterium]|nr:signal peptidase I [Gemmatimonadota bacterium]